MKRNNNNYEYEQMANFSFLTIAHASFFSLNTSGPMFIVKNQQKVVLRQVLGACSFRIKLALISH